MRKKESGINYIFYNTDTKKEAEKWYKELTGRAPEHDDIIYFRDAWTFRLHK